MFLANSVVKIIIGKNHLNCKFPIKIIANKLNRIKFPIILFFLNGIN